MTIAQHCDLPLIVQRHVKITPRPGTARHRFSCFCQVHEKTSTLDQPPEFCDADFVLRNITMQISYQTENHKENQ